MSLEILTQPAQFNSTVSVLSSVKAATIELTHARAETLYNPATATGAFLLLSVNGVNKAIQLWDYVPQVLAIRFIGSAQDGDWSNPLNWTDADGRSPATILPLGDFDVQIFADIAENTGNPAQARTYSFYDSANNHISLFAFSSFTFYNNSTNSGTLQGNVTFLDNSKNADFYGALGTVTGNANFYNNSTNEGIIEGNADVWYPVPVPFGGIVQGTLTYHGYPVRFTNAAGDGDWSNLDNWTDDTGAPATYLPTSGIDVKIYDKVTKVSQGQAIAHNASFFNSASLEQITLNVTNSAIFHDTTYNFGAIVGNAKFLDSSTNGTASEPIFFTPLHMHFDGPNGGQDFIDDSNYHHTITYGGNAYISTDHGVFEGEGFDPYAPPSLFLDGSSYVQSTPVGDEYQFGTNDFTIEFWAYPTAGPATGWTPILALGNGGQPGGIGQEIRIGQNINSTGNFGFIIPNNSNDVDVRVNASTPLELNNWTHLALVRHGSTVTLYANGFEACSITGVSFDFTNAGPVRLGYAFYSVDGHYTGFIDELRVVNGKAIYTGQFNVPVQPLDNVDAIVPTVLGNAEFDSSSLNIAGVVGNASFNGSATNGEVPNTNGPKVELLMHFDGDLTDSSTNNFTFSNNGASTDNSVVKFGTGSLNCNNNGWISSSLSNPITLVGDFTIECFFYLNDFNPDYASFISGNNGGDSNGFLFYIETDQTIGLIATTGTSNTNNWNIQVKGSWDGGYNQWRHLAVTRSNGYIQVFLDGNQIASGNNSDPIIPVNNIQMGSYLYYAGSTQRYTDGYIDEARIINGEAKYTSNFTPPTAPFTLPVPTSKTGSVSGTAVFNGSTQNLNGIVFDAKFNDSSINSSVVSNSAIFAGASQNVGSVSGNAVFHDTATNGQFIDTLLLMHFDDSYGSQNFVDSSTHNTSFGWDGYPYIDNSQSEFGGSSIYFDGNSSDIYPANNAGNNFNFGTGDFTIEFWFYMTNYSCNPQVMFDMRDGSDDRFCIFIRPCYSWQVTFNTQYDGDVIIGNNNQVNPYDGWHHVAVSKQNGTTRLFVDGNLQGTYSDSHNYTTQGNRPLIGNSFDNYPFTGWMDELRIVKGKAIYTQNFTPPSAPLSVLQGVPGNIAGNASFYGTSQNASGILYTADFHDYSFNNSDIYAGTFYDHSYNNTNGALLSASFLDYSINYGSVIYVATVQAQSHNYGTINHADVYYPAHYPLEGSFDSVTYYGYNFGCTNPAANNYNPNANIDDGSCTYTLNARMSAYWSLDETSGTRSDSTGHGNNLLDPNNNVTSDTGIINKAAVFDGNNYLEIN
jgi:Concanavalin A-like lectin/glucanases superfamily